MKDNDAYGHRQWAFSAGKIPLHSIGREPMFTSHDKIAMLNASAEDATVRITIYYENGDPVGEHEIVVKALRVRKIKFNDLIDPFPIPLETPYGFCLESDIPIVVQVSRMITSGSNITGFFTTPFFRP